MVEFQPTGGIFSCSGQPPPHPADKETLLFQPMPAWRNRFPQGTIDVQRMCRTCAHYRGDRKGELHCALLGIVMGPKDLRTDRPEHKPATDAASR